MFINICNEVMGNLSIERNEIIDQLEFKWEDPLNFGKPAMPMPDGDKWCGSIIAIVTVALPLRFWPSFSHFQIVNCNRFQFTFVWHLAWRQAKL